MEEIKYLKTIEEIRGFSDPYRYRILNCFYKAGEPATVKQVADELGEVPAKVHYHVKKMEKVDILRLVYTKEINGIIAKYYEPTAKKFNIVGDEEDNSPNPLVLSEIQKVAAGIFDEGKQTFLDNLVGEEKAQDRGFLSMENIYLTSEELQGFRKYIMDYLDKNVVRKNSDNPDSKEYQCFFSMVRIDKKK